MIESTNQKIERFAKALRETQIETGIEITPNDAIVIWNDYDQDTICGFKVYKCPSGGFTMATTDESPYLLRLIRLIEDYMSGI